MNLKSDISLFFSDIFNFFKGGRVLGIDVGTVSIKLVELKRKKGHLVLANYGILEHNGYLDRLNEAIQTSSLKILEKDLIKLLKILLKETKTKSRLAFVSLPNFLVFTTTFDIPLLSLKETEKVVFFQAHGYVPLPLSEVKIDWLKTDEYINEKGQRYQKILLVAVPQEVIEKYKYIFKKADLNLVSLEIEAYALVRSLIKKEAKPTIVFDIGALSSTILIAEAGQLKMVRQTDYAAFNLTQALSRSLDISVKRAESLKKLKGLLAEESEREFSASMMPFLDVIIQEGIQLKNDYERFYKKKVEKLMVVGGGGNLLGIELYISKQMNLGITQPLPFSDISYKIQLEPVINDLSKRLAVALGLAIKGLL